MTRQMCRCLLTITAFTLSGCGGEEINSAWRATPISIDGMAGDWSQVEFQKAHGVEVMVGLSFNNSLIYEVKVALVDADAAVLSIGGTVGGIVGIGLDSPEFDRQAMIQQMQGQGGTGRGGRGGGGRGGGRSDGKVGMGGGSRGGPTLETPEPIEAWGKVRLSRGA